MMEDESPQDDCASWELPYLEDTRRQDDGKTNVYNRKSEWKYEPPEPEIEILPPTAEEIEQIRQAAYQEGFEKGHEEGTAKGFDEGKQQGQEQGHREGFEQGQSEGLQAGQEQINEHVATLQSILERLHRPVELVETQLQDELVKLSVSLAKAVIRQQVSTDRKLLINALNEALGSLPLQESHYQLHMHPDDIEYLKQHYSEQHIAEQKWLFVANEQMSRGGCDVSTQSNAIDVSIERRTKDILDKFLLEQGLSDIDTD